MKKRTLGNGGLEVSAIGFGCMGLLVDQLRAAGFAQDDVDEILYDVDYSRRIEGIR